MRAVVFESPSGEARQRRAAAWLDERRDKPVTIVGASVAAATATSRRALSTRGSTLGWRRLSLPLLAATASGCHALWLGRRDGEPDVYTTLMLGHQPYGPATAGSGGLAPTLTAEGAPGIGTVFTLTLANGLGGASAGILYGQDGPLSLPILGGTLLVAPPLDAIPVTLGGTVGVPGAGSADVPAALPNALSLIGTRFNLQAIVVDPGAPSNIAFTNGLETWVL